MFHYILWRPYFCPIYKAEHLNVLFENLCINPKIQFCLLASYSCCLSPLFSYVTCFMLFFSRRRPFPGDCWLVWEHWWTGRIPGQSSGQSRLCSLGSGLLGLWWLALSPGEGRSRVFWRRCRVSPETSQGNFRLVVWIHPSVTLTAMLCDLPWLWNVSPPRLPVVLQRTVVFFSFWFVCSICN